MGGYYCPNIGNNIGNESSRIKELSEYFDK